MADQKISAFTDGGFLQSGDEIVIARSGTDLRISGSNVAPYFNAKSYGALGDSTTDDTAAIQAALNAAAAAGGGFVFLPPGRYRVTAPLLVNADTVCIIGSGTGAATGTTQAAGIGSRIEVDATFVGSEVILVQKTSNDRPLYGVTLRDFVIDGKSVAGPIDGIYWRSNRGLIDHVHVQNCSGVGIRSRGYVNGFDSATADWNLDDTHFTFVQVGGCGSDGFFFTSNATDMHIVSCLAYSNGQDGIHFQYDSTTLNGASSCQITATHTYSNTRHNIYFEGTGTRSKLVNCKVETAGQYGIYFDSMLQGFTDITIANCNFADNGTTTTNTYSHIGYFRSSGTNAVSRTTVVGCSFTWKNNASNPNKPKYGIDLGVSSGSISQNATIIGNVFGSATMFGTAPMHVPGTAVTPLVKHNNGWITEAGGSSTQTPGAVSTVTIAHGLAAAPTKWSVVPGDTNSRGEPAFYVTADATNVTLNFASPLTAATSYTWVWSAEV